eukprot:CAMPEP_0175318764 /NCGR_PEP_ID=MMETSP0093-20121207/70598_1 /TAXON_ID=311494 /ORGANISM="Alexandrium monilatum, Strain CCMP3105" /LENGTH=280 /DNA_ID=CAMNT_0016615573 /DNA_START=84 /DNA_END=921 /DNA_ORIENTATION=-
MQDVGDQGADNGVGLACDDQRAHVGQGRQAEQGAHRRLDAPGMRGVQGAQAGHPDRQSSLAPPRADAPEGVRAGEPIRKLERRIDGDASSVRVPHQHDPDLVVPVGRHEARCLMQGMLQHPDGASNHRVRISFSLGPRHAIAVHGHAPRHRLGHGGEKSAVVKVQARLAAWAHAASDAGKEHRDGAHGVPVGLAEVLADANLGAPDMQGEVRREGEVAGSPRDPLPLANLRVLPLAMRDAAGCLTRLQGGGHAQPRQLGSCSHLEVHLGSCAPELGACQA